MAVPVRIWPVVFILFLSAAIAMVKTSSYADSDKQLCDTLKSSALHNKIIFPSNNDTFPDGANAYFSNQERALIPQCIVQPDTVEDVATIVSTIQSMRSEGKNIKFAVRSGGHTPYQGAANIQSGVTIDMRKFNTTTVHPDRTRVTIGTGSTWGAVYSQLDPQGLAVSGGRVAAIGVGGLTLGGGLSFFSPRKGLVCDNVLSFEIVLADGSIQTVTQDSDPDLWVALKGGSNNFGIVTSFDVRSFHQGEIFYGQYYYTLDTTDQQLDAFHQIAASPNYDEYISIITSFGFAKGKGSAVVNVLVYTKPDPDPAPLANFTKISYLMTSARVTSLTNATVEQGGSSAGEFEQLYITTTLKEDRSMLRFGYDLWNSSVAKVSDIDGVVWSLTYQPLPPIITSKAQSLGGNTLGLSPESNLVITQLTVTWNKASDNDFIQSQANDFINALETEAKSRSLYSNFKYLNYADRNQDPIGGYGQENVAKLQEVSKKYDPSGLFQEALSGGFKVFN